MADREQILRFLSGGIVAISNPSGGDGVTAPAGTEQSPVQRPEVTPPESQLKDRESFLGGVSSQQILVGTAVLVGALGLMAFARN